MMTKAREKRETQTKVIWGVGGWNPYNGDDGEGLRRPWLNSWRNCVHCRGWNPRCKGRLHKHSGETLLQAAIKTKPFWQIPHILCDWKRNRFIVVEAYLWYQLTLHSRREVNVPESEIDGKTNPCDTLIIHSSRFSGGWSQKEIRVTFRSFNHRAFLVLVAITPHA